MSHISSMSDIGEQGQRQIRKLFRLDDQGRARVEVGAETMVSLREKVLLDHTKVNWSEVVDSTQVYDAWRGVFNRHWVDWWTSPCRGPYAVPAVRMHTLMAKLVWCIRKHYTIVWRAYTSQVADQKDTGSPRAVRNLPWRVAERMRWLEILGYAPAEGKLTVLGLNPLEQRAWMQKAVVQVRGITSLRECLNPYKDEGAQWADIQREAERKLAWQKRLGYNSRTRARAVTTATTQHAKAWAGWAVRNGVPVPAKRVKPPPTVKECSKCGWFLCECWWKTGCLQDSELLGGYF